MENGKRFNLLKCMTLLLTLVLWCVGCSGDDSSSTNASSDNQGEFTHVLLGSPLYEERREELKEFFTKDMFDTIFAGSHDNLSCREKEEIRKKLDLPEDKANGQWYYTYDNLIGGMSQWKEFAGEGDANTRKLEIAAFLANIAQETGTHDGDAFGGPGCAIEEGYGTYWGSAAYSSYRCGTEYDCAEAGYMGRGPHQLSWDYNYRAFGEAMAAGDKYLKDPDLLTTSPTTGIAGSIWFWGHQDLGSGNDPNKPFKPSAHSVVVAAGEPTAKAAWKPSENDISCGRKTANLGVITNIINGGIECCRNYWGADTQGGKISEEQASETARQKAAECCVDEPVCDWKWASTVCAAWRCCAAIDCINEDCQQPKEQALNRVKYFEKIAEAMGVTIPDGFIDYDCRSQLSFPSCLSYPQ